MFKQEGYDLIGAAFEVYNVLGYGMAEEIYQQSLEVELRLRNIPFLSKAELPVVYKNHQLKTFYRPDVLVCNEIVVELKAAKALAPEHEAQLFNYMRISRKKSATWSTTERQMNWSGNELLFERRNTTNRH